MKYKRGFTLIEVISVLVILGLLATIIATQYSTTISGSRESLNEEQKSRLIEVAKNVSLNNKSCLEIAKNSPDGVKITLDQMKKNGYIANTQLKNLTNNADLNGCVIIKYDENYNKFDYAYSEECGTTQSCMVTAESEKVIVSSFYVGDNNTHYTNQRNVSYYMRYSTSISAEYCVTLENEASCNWKKLGTSTTSATGNLTLTDAAENIAHLYIRNSNKNIIASIDDIIIFDSNAPTCVWKSPDKSYIRNGSSTEIVLSCTDIAGIRNTELLSTAININNSSLVSISDAIVTTNGTNKEFKFTVYGGSGGGDVNLSLKPGVISDMSGNFVNNEYTSGPIYLDNISPNGDVTIGDLNNRYTNSDKITLHFSNVSLDVEKMCVSNSSEGNCSYVNYASTYNWVLNGTQGSNTIFVSLIDRAGNVTTKSVNVYLDTFRPNCLVPPNSQPNAIKNGNAVDYVVMCTDENEMGGTVLDSSMLLINEHGDAHVNVSVINNGTTVHIEGLSGNGEVIVSLKRDAVYDAAGNGNELTEIARVVVDNIPPINNSIIINRDATITHLRGLSIKLDSEIKNDNGGYYCLTSTNDVSSCSNWVDYSSNGSFNTGQSVGTYTVYAFFKDIAGNISPSSVSDSIKYDPEALTCSLSLESDSMVIRYSDESKVADNPFSQDTINWNNNNSLPLTEGKYYYYSYIKDKNGDINFCELNIE